MKRLVQTSSGLVALALVVLGSAGCNAGWSPYAARVDGTSVSVGQLQQALSEVAGTSYYCVVRNETGGRLRIRGAGLGDDSYDTTFADDVLTTLVKADVARSQVASLHLPLPASARSIASSEIASVLEQEAAAYPSCQTTGEKILGQLGTSYGGAIIDLQLAQDALAADLAGTNLTTAALQAYEMRNLSATSESCTSLIEVATKAKAASIRQSIEAGASFATEANQHSIYTASTAPGGAVGCLIPSQVAQPVGTDLEHLAVGQVSQPISFQGDWFLLLVTKRQLEPLDQLVAQLYTARQAAVQKRLSSAVSTARIQVASGYGSWSASAASGTGGVVPPSGPNPSYVPNPSQTVGSTTPIEGAGGDLGTSGSGG